MATEDSRDMRSRWLEVAVAVIVAVATSAATTFMAVPAAMARFDERLKDHDRRLVVHDQALTSSANENRVSTSTTLALLAALSARQDSDDQLRLELNKRLETIEQQQREILRELRR